MAAERYLHFNICDCTLSPTLTVFIHFFVANHRTRHRLPISPASADSSTAPAATLHQQPLDTRCKTISLRSSGALVAEDITAETGWTERQDLAGRVQREHSQSSALNDGDDVYVHWHDISVPMSFWP